MGSTLRLFGPPVLLVDGLPVTGPAVQRHRLALLALLAGSRNRVIGRERAAAMLWPEATPSQSRHLINVAVYELRRVLGEPVLQTRNGDLGLGPGLWADLIEFEAAVAAQDYARAAELHTAPFLDDFLLPASEEFETWAETIRARCLAGWAEALDHLAREAMAEAAPLRAMEHWRRLAAAQPFSSRAVLGLMESMAAVGDATSALQVAREHQARLERELGAGPDPTVAELTLRLERRTRSTPRVPESGSAPEPAAPVVLHGEPPATLPTSTARRPGRWLAGAAALTAAMLFVFDQWAGPDPVVTPAVSVGLFANLSGRPELDSLGRLAAGRVSQGLASTGLMAVVDAAPDPGQRGRGVRLRVSGGYHLSGDSLILSARLTEAGGQVVATVHVAGQVGDPGPAVEELRSRAMGALAMTVDPDVVEVSALAGVPPTYPAYLEFVAALERPGPASVPRFLRAASLDTLFTLPLLWAAYWGEGCGPAACGVPLDSVLGVLDGRRGSLGPADRLGVDMLMALRAGHRTRALELGRRAASLAPRSPWAEKASYLALDLARPEEAMTLLQPLMAPGSWGRRRPGLWVRLAGLYHWTGDYRRQSGLTAPGEEAATTILAGARLSGLAALGEGARVPEDFRHLVAAPGGGSLLSQAAVLVAELRAHGAADAAAEMARLCVSELADIPGAGLELAECLIYDGRYAEARRLFESLAREGPQGWAPPGWIHGRLGMLAAFLGDTAAAARHRRLLEQTPQGTGLAASRLSAADAVGLAMIAVAVGQAEEARRHLRRAFSLSGNWELMARDPGIFPFDRLSAGLTAPPR